MKYFLLATLTLTAASCNAMTGSFATRAMIAKFDADKAEAWNFFNAEKELAAQLAECDKAEPSYFVNIQKLNLVKALRARIHSGILGRSEFGANLVGKVERHIAAPLLCEILQSKIESDRSQFHSDVLIEFVKVGAAIGPTRNRAKL